MSKTVNFINLWISIALCVCAGYARAEPRALLIGVGVYANPSNDLPGIDTDIDIMKKVAGNMGFTEHQIRIIRDEDANRSNLELAFSTWLKDGVNQDDPVLIYFSGHGSQIADNNSDEKDGFDEALVLHEVGVAGEIDNGMLRDDDLNNWISAIPSNKKILLVDACCSGSVAKGLTLSRSFKDVKTVIKSIQCPSAGTAGAGLISDDTTVLKGLVQISAAQDNQLARASEVGSIFTIALDRALDENRDMNATELVNSAGAFISKHLPEEVVHHPSLLGDPALIKAKGLFVIENQSPQPVTRQLYREIIDAADARFDMIATKENYREGETIEFMIDMPFDGYLNLILVDEDDSPLIMFPNSESGDSNWRKQGPLPMPEGRFRFEAKPPHGRSTVVALATKQEVNLYRDSLDKNFDGSASSTFVYPADHSLRKFTARYKSTGGFHAGTVNFSTCVSGC